MISAQLKIKLFQQGISDGCIEQMKNLSMKNILLYIVSACLLIPGFTGVSYGQEKAYNRYMQYEFSKAIPKYEKILSKDSLNRDALENLGNCYRLTNQTEKAEKCYAKVVQIPKTENVYKLYYAQMLLTNEKVSE